MPEYVLPGPITNCNGVTEAVTIHTCKVFDSCRDKDCIEDLRVYLAPPSQAVADNAISLKGGSAELLCVYIDVESVPFNRGFYTVDATYYYRVTANAYSCGGRPAAIEGLAVYNKRVILCGGEGGAKYFSSRLPCCFPGSSVRSELPTAIVEAVDPIVLNIKLCDGCACECECCAPDIPACVMDCFSESISFHPGAKRVFVTLGQFSVIKLEREAQLLIPTFEYCLPDKQCGCSGGGGCEACPCDLFNTIDFPVDDFCPRSCFDGCNSCG